MFEILIALTGFVFGIILALIAPEETKPGEKYLLLGKHFLLALILIFSLYYRQEIYVILPIIIYLFLYIFLIRKLFWGDLVNYGFLIFIFFINLKNAIVISSLIFLYGLPAGTLFRLWWREKKEKKYAKNKKRS